MGCERCDDRGELAGGRAAEEAAPATSKVRGSFAGARLEDVRQVCSRFCLSRMRAQAESKNCVGSADAGSDEHHTATIDAGTLW